MSDFILRPKGTMKLRGGTAAVMASENPLLARREVAAEVDTGKLKVGNGADRWNALPYVGGSSSGGNHEELEGLLGGKDGEHFHIEEEQHRRLKILIKALFPTDTDKIYIPYIDDRDPDHPILLPYTPFEDIPKGTPPEWQIHQIFAGGSNLKGVKVLYYGKFNDLGDCLAVFCNSNAYYIKEISTFTNLSIGSSSLPTVVGVYETRGGYLNSDTTSELIFLHSDSSIYLHFAYSTSEDGRITSISTAQPYGKASNGSNVKGTVYSATVSPELGVLIFAAKSSSIYHKTKSGTSFTKSYTEPIKMSNGSIFSNPSVSPNGLAWSPVAQLFVPLQMAV